MPSNPKDNSNTIREYIEQAKLNNQAELIVARYTKRIWSDTAYNIYSYNQRIRLMEADLTIALSEDEEYQSISNRLRELNAKFFVMDLEAEDEFSIRGKS